MDAAIIIKDAKMKAGQLADESRELKSTFESSEEIMVIC